MDVREADVCRFGPHGCAHAQALRMPLPYLSDGRLLRKAQCALAYRAVLNHLVYLVMASRRPPNMALGYPVQHWSETNLNAQCGCRRLVVPASAVRARDDDESSPAAGSWTARAAKFLRAETFQLSDTIARRRPRAHAGDKDPKQKPKDAGSPAGRQASAKPRRRRASTQSPQRRPRGVPAQAGAAVTGAGGGPGSGASAGGSAPDPDTDAAAHSGQTDPPAANGSADAPEGGGKGGCEGGSDGDAQAAAAPKAGDVTEGAGGSPLKALQVKIGPRGPGGAHKHWTPASWWRGQAGGTAWEDYEIRPERLLPGSCPLLVFVNTKSGPQAGAALRRRFLRLLNPLQVTDTQYVTVLVVFYGHCICGHARTMPRHQRLSHIFCGVVCRALDQGALMRNPLGLAPQACRWWSCRARSRRRRCGCLRACRGCACWPSAATARSPGCWAAWRSWARSGRRPGCPGTRRRSACSRWAQVCPAPCSCGQARAIWLAAQVRSLQRLCCAHGQRRWAWPG